MKKILIITLLSFCGIGFSQEKVIGLEPSPVYSSYDSQYWDKLANEQRRLLVERFENLVTLTNYNLTVRGDTKFLEDLRYVKYYLEELGHDHVTIREFEYRMNIAHHKLNRAIARYNKRLKKNN